jgi:hypothetical protein
MGDAPEITLHFSNAPGWIVLRWVHSFEDVYGFIVERLEPSGDTREVLNVNSPTDEFVDKFLDPSTTYSHRVCAVYDYGLEWSDWVPTTTMAPEQQTGSGSTQPSAPPPPPLSTPVLTARATGTRNIHLEWDYDYADRLTSMAVYRDNDFIFDGAIPGNFTRTCGDSTPRFNTEYTYKLCFSNPDEQNKCSEPVIAKGLPVAPTAPADVSVFRNPAGSASSPSGAFQLRPRHTMTISWRNTDVPGQFITVEALDTFPGDPLGGGLLYAGPQERWIETARVSAKNDPTSLTIDIPLSVISTTRLTTFRVCAVVPELGEAGKACSGAVTLQ